MAGRRSNLHKSSDYQDYLRDLYQNGPDVDDFEEYTKAITYEQVVDWRRQHPTKWKSSDLTFDDAVRVYNAMSYALWRFGPEGRMTGHVIVVWGTYGVTNHQRAAELLGEFLNRAKKKWERPVSSIEGRTGRQRWRSRTNGTPLHYVYVHEHDPHMGFHSHVLLTLPAYLAVAFDAWSRKVLTDLTKHSRRATAGVDSCTLRGPVTVQLAVASTLRQSRTCTSIDPTHRARQAPIFSRHEHAPGCDKPALASRRATDRMD